MKRAVGVVIGFILSFSLIATAQESRSEISLQGTGLFTKDATGNGTTYSSTESAGGMVTYRFHFNRWISAEGAYGYSQDTQKYALSSNAFRIQAGIHQFTGSMVFNLPSSIHSRLNPYVLAGAGGLRFAPTGNQFNSLSGAQSQTKGTFVYGAGINYAILKNLSFRAEYRGFVYSNPDFGFGALSTNSLTHSAMPSVGISFRF